MSKLVHWARAAAVAAAALTSVAGAGSALAQAVLFGLSLAVFAIPAHAQDANFGKGVWLTEANCADCHGWLGDGNNEDPRSPRGANLRKTSMTAEQLSETIMCGRPGTAMPYFDLRAYADDAHKCYGMTKAQVGDQMPQPGLAQLTKRHADGLAAFIMRDFAGKGDATKSACEALLGAGNARCATLPAAP